MLYEIRWLCPDCGKLHQIEIKASTPDNAVKKFTAYWAEMEEQAGELVQLPLLLMVAELGGEHDDKKE